MQSENAMNGESEQELTKALEDANEEAKKKDVKDSKKK